MSLLFNLGMLVLPLLGGAIVRQGPADLTGTWDVTAKFSIVGGPADGQSTDMKAVFQLAQKGTAVSGTFVPYEVDGKTPKPALPILDGRVSSGKVTFRVKQDAQTLTFALVFADGHLRGDATPTKDLEGGGKLTIALDAARRK